MKRFFNLSTIITTAVLVAGIVIFLCQANYAAAIMTAVALSCACTARRSELLVQDGLDLLDMYKKITGDLISHRDKLMDENKTLGERVTQLLEESAKESGNDKGKTDPQPEGKEHVELPEPQQAQLQSQRPQGKKRSRSKRPIQDIKESLKEISPKKEGE